MEVSLRDIDKDNYRQAIALTVAPGQEHFVASNAVSLADAKFHPTCVPLGIYAGDAMVGFLMYVQDEDTGQWIIARVMIAAGHQRKGYGRAALEQIITRFKTNTGAKEVFLSYEPENDVARRLYAGLGFVETGEIRGGEVVARLHLAR